MNSYDLYKELERIAKELKNGTVDQRYISGIIYLVLGAMGIDQEKELYEEMKVIYQKIYNEWDRNTLVNLENDRQ